MKPKFVLIDLPVYPKGVISLSLFAVAGSLKQKFDVVYFDLNIEEEETVIQQISFSALVGLKVSSQNLPLALLLTQKIKQAHPAVITVWGGEYATLASEECAGYADVVISGLFEPIANSFVQDFENEDLKKYYSGENNFALDELPQPDFSVLKSLHKYSSFMGLPLETSRGCTEKCAFCMVHVMQKKNYFLKSSAQLKLEIKNYAGRFINLIDYNFGVNKEHVIQTSKIIKESDALGWMAEMCIELLDNDDLLKALSDSRCKMIYCGLESIEEDALKSVHKMNTNHIENYERIIRKVQSYGIQIAAGLILGIANSTEATYRQSFDFFQRMGLVYVKLTFLTYNPGTKVHTYMGKKGDYVVNGIDEYDGVRMSYLPMGVNKEVVIDGAEYFIQNFYSLSSIIARSQNTKLNLLGKIEFVLFSYCYAQVYREWLGSGFLRKPPKFNLLMDRRFQKNLFVRTAEKLLNVSRKINR